MQNRKYSVLIIGSGPAGCTAGIYSVRSGLKTAIISGQLPGGQLTTTTIVENYPGIKNILGPDLMKNMIDQAENLGVEIFPEIVIKIKKEGNDFILETNENIFYSKTVIVCTGSKPRFLGVKNEKELIGRGVSTCATCDGAFFRNKTVAVIGGGNSAVEEATYLARIAKEVFLIHRRKELRADKIMQKRLAMTNIKMKLGCIVDEIQGKEKLESIIIQNNLKQKEKLTINGLFLAIGYIPNTKIFQKMLKLDPDGYIIRINRSETSMKGVFTAGDVTDYRYRQAVTSAADGCKAAIDAKEFLEDDIFKKET